MKGKKMKTNQISQLLGVKISNQNKKEALEISNFLLFKIIKLFKSKNFGLITFYGVNQRNLKQHQQLLQTAENYLLKYGLNFIKIMAKWNLKFRDVLNFNEVGYFILNPTFTQMIEITKRFDQDLFVYSENYETQAFYANGDKIKLEKDNYDFGSIASNALILNFVDFKLFIDSIIDFNFHFIGKDEIKIEDQIVILAKNKFTSETHLEIVDVYDIRQNGIISFERSKTTPAISPKVFHFDEIVWAFKVNHKNENTGIKIYKNVV